MLYLYVIQKRASPPGAYDGYLSAATRCQSHLSGIAEKGSLPERYCLVLEELRVEAVRQTSRAHQAMTNTRKTNSNPQEDQVGGTPEPVNSNTGAVTDSERSREETVFDFGSIAGSDVSDYAGWGQFASMVSSGLGNLDVFLHDDDFAFDL